MPEMVWRKSPKGYQECIAEPWLAFTVSREGPLSTRWIGRAVVRPSASREYQIAQSVAYTSAQSAQEWARKWMRLFVLRHTPKRT
jgi:hypothetical protein